MVNSALCATLTRDPLLRHRAAGEWAQLERLAAGLARRVALVPFALRSPVSPPLLLQQVLRGEYSFLFCILMNLLIMTFYIVRNSDDFPMNQPLLT